MMLPCFLRVFYVPLLFFYVLFCTVLGLAKGPNKLHYRGHGMGCFAKAVLYVIYRRIDSTFSGFQLQAATVLHGGGHLARLSSPFSIDICICDSWRKSKLARRLKARWDLDCEAEQCNLLY